MLKKQTNRERLRRANVNNYFTFLYLKKYSFIVRNNAAIYVIQLDDATQLRSAVTIAFL